MLNNVFTIRQAGGIIASLMILYSVVGCAAGSTGPNTTAVFLLTPYASTISATGTVQLTLAGPSGSSGQVQAYDTTCIHVSPSSVPVGQVFTVTGEGVACQITITVVGSNYPSNYLYTSSSNATATITVQ